MSNVRDADDDREQTVYRCYDEAGQLLYIGCTGDLEYRLSLHNPIVIRETHKIVTQVFPDRPSGRAAERAAIAAECPLLNKQHNPKVFRKVAGGGYEPVEPIHPLTAELIRQSQPVTLDEMREALEKVSDFLGLDVLFGKPKVNA